MWDLPGSWIEPLSPDWQSDSLSLSHEGRPEIVFFISLDMYPWVELLDHMVFLYSGFLRTSILFSKIPWTEEPGRLQSMGSLRVRHDWATHFHFSLSCIGEGNGNPLQCSCLENPRGGGAWWAAVYGVAKSQTRLKRLSSSSSSILFSIVTTSIYIPTNNVLGFPFLHILVNIGHL